MSETYDSGQRGASELLQKRDGQLSPVQRRDAAQKPIRGILMRMELN